MTTQNEAYRPRLSVEITTEQAESLRKLIPWGLKNQLFSIIIDDVVRLATSHGQHFIAAVLAKAVRLEEFTALEVPENDDD